MMDLNSVLARDEGTVWNQKVEVHLDQLPIYLQKDLPMQMHRKKRHTQPGIEINITHKGSASFVVGNKIYVQSAKHVILFPGHYPHQVFPDQSSDYGRTVLCLKDILLDADYDGLSLLGLDEFVEQGCLHFKLSNGEYMQLTSILQSIEEEFRERRIGWKRMLFSRLLEMVVILERKLESLQVNNSAEDHFVDVCAAFVEEHLHEDLSLQRVARLFSVSAEHLTRSFSRQKGQSFYQYVLLQRVLESKRQLSQHPQKSVTDIAYSLGFSSSSQFSRTFKSLTKETPSEFRSRISNNDQ